MVDQTENLKKVLRDPVCLGKLEDLARLCAESETHGSFQLAAFDDDTKIQKLFKVLVGRENYTFLVWRDTGEEVVLQVQGLLVACSLPPLSSRSKPPIKCAHIMKQSVMICGDDCKSFHTVLSALRRIQYVDENFSIGVVHGFEISNSAGFNTIMASTHLLTPVESKMWSSIQEGPSMVIDPKHVLRDLVKTGRYQFTEDNIVGYWEMLPDIVEGNLGLCSTLAATEANPGIFRPGQLVEMSINIRALQMGSLCNVVLHMDSLTMHDHYGASLLANMKPSKSVSELQDMTITPRKCKVSIDDIIVGRGVRARMQDMSIGESEGGKVGESSKMVL
ncbi:hypothetical protein PILCRDRAFT_7287 [Piloderma croceum F 1598]|uniref:Uncharacterized protein n=1 Tax=Piloderma croceum (strain F 1598) TaxID=765440 RepID=A0A0C3FYM8_PILCF|nr:hypothetical protein PILCRDRAFT_7287 [Piloderma croceum F 1598]